MSKTKIPVGVLGATGSVGQKFIQLLANHPVFEIAEVAASEKSTGKKYSEAVNWILDSPVPEAVATKIVKPCIPDMPCTLVFSGLDSAVAGEIETQFAEKGYLVVSNAKNHRTDDDVPLLIPEVNPDHLDMLRTRPENSGAIVTNPNCSTIGMVMALKPLYDAFGLEEVNVTTMQAVSGAGFPGVPALSIHENVIPFISGEEDKMETEPLKLLGMLNNGKVEHARLKISAQCNRVPVLDGHMEAVQVKLRQPATVEEIISVWRNFKSAPQDLDLHLAPHNPIIYFEEDVYPQPRLHRNLDKGMAVSIGRLRKCPIFDYKFMVLSHNTIRGAAGGAILCAELMEARGFLTK